MAAPTVEAVTALPHGTAEEVEFRQKLKMRWAVAIVLGDILGVVRDFIILLLEPPTRLSKDLRLECITIPQEITTHIILVKAPEVRYYRQ